MNFDELVEKLGHVKVNLTKSNKGPNGEGLWAVCCSQEDQDIHDDEYNMGAQFNVYLCNQPITWDANFGDKVIAINNGSLRAHAEIQHNKDFSEIDLFEEEENNEYK